MEAVNADEANISARDVGEQVLKFFWDLASLNQEARSTAAVGLVAELKSIQADFEASKDAAAGGAHSPSLVYGLKRLVRGLASGRQGARQGYALALTKLLADIPALPVSEVLSVMTSELEVSGQAKGTEAHDQLLGQVFGFAAVIRSGQQIDDETAVKCADGLVYIANKKSFLRELATNVLVELTEKLKPAALRHILKQDSSGVKAWLVAPVSDSHPEGLLLALRLWGSLPAPILAETKLLPANVQPPPADFFTNSASTKDSAAEAAAAFFSEQHLEKLVAVVRGSSSSHPRLHSLWGTLLSLPDFTPLQSQENAEVSQTSNKGSSGSRQLEALWTVIVQDLFTSSHERKALGFQLFTTLLPDLKPEQIPIVFSRNFVRCFTNNLISPSTYLHSSAQHCVKRIVAFADKAGAIPGMKIALAVALQGVGGKGFDKLTNTSTVAKLLQSLDAGSLGPYIHNLQAQFSTGRKLGSNSEEEQDIDKERQLAIDQMSSVANIKSAPGSVKTEVLKFLAMHAFFAVDKASIGKGKPKELKVAVQAQPAPSTATRQLCAAKLLFLVDSASKAAQAPSAPTHNKTESKSKKRKATALADSPETAAAPESVQAARLESPFLVDIVDFVSKVQRTSGVTLAAELPAEVDGALSKLRESAALAATKLDAAAAGGQGQQLRSMLALMRWLQLYMLADPAATQPDVAADLQGVFTGAFTKAKPVAGEPHWMDVLVDILLSLLGRSGDALPFGPLREACEALFRAFAEQVTSQGFGDLVRVVQLAPEGQADEGEDDGLFEEEEEDEDMLAGSDQAGAAVAAIEDAANTEDEEEEVEEDEDDDEEAVDAALDATDASGSSDEEDFDDDQMFQMDDKIAAALRVMARGGANARESREAISSFRFRVIGLIEVYLKKVPSSSVVPAALPALLAALTRACQQGGDAALANRLRALVSALGKAQAHSQISISGEEVSVPAGEAMAVLLCRSLYLASRHKDKKVTSAASTAFAYLLRSSTTSEGGSTSEAQAAAKAALEDFFGKKKSKLHRKLFEDIMARSVMLSSQVLLPAIVLHTHKARSGYVKADGTALLLAFLKSSQNQQNNSAVAKAFRSHVPLLAELTTAAASGDVAQSAKQIEALKDICSCMEQLKKVYPQESLQGLMGPQEIQLVNRSIEQARAATPKSKVDVQLKRLEILMNESVSKVPYAEQARGNQKSSKKPKNEQSSDAMTKSKKPKAKKSSAARKELAKAQPGGPPKRTKNKDKYKRKKPLAA